MSTIRIPAQPGTAREEVAEGFRPSATPGSSLTDVLDSLAALGAEFAGSSRGGTQLVVRCQSAEHVDENASLEIAEGDDGVVFNCQPCMARLGGDSKAFAAELRAAGVNLGRRPFVPAESYDFGPPAPGHGGGSDPGAGWDERSQYSAFVYRDERGENYIKVERWDGRKKGKRAKSFAMHHYDKLYGWQPTLDNCERIPYRLDELVAQPKRTIFLTEGEKCADALKAAGVLATTFPSGAAAVSKYPTGWARRWFAGRKVVVWADRDAAGLDWSNNVAKELHAAGAKVRRVVSATTSPKDDAYDHLAAGHKPKDFVPLTPEVAAEIRNGSQAEVTAGSQSDDVRERFPLLNIVELLDPDRLPREWLLDGVIPLGDHTSIVAPGGTGKSLLALALALAAVRGAESFAGRALRFAPERKLLYIDMENSEDDWHERLSAFGVTQDEARELLGARFFPLSFPALHGLDTAPGARELLAVLDAYGFSAGDVVVLDSTQRLTVGAENDNDTIRALYNAVGLELKRRGLTVIRTDNTGHEGTRARGASAKGDDVGYSYLLTPVVKSGEVFRLENTKFRGKGSGDVLTFARVTDSDGVLHFDPIAPESVPVASTAAMRRVVEFVAEHPGASGNDIRGGVRGRNTTVNAALDAAKAQGLIRVTVDGQTIRHDATDDGRRWLDELPDDTDSSP